jgi:pimeloyl-ACP methyl ester carboxylesterase
MAVADVGGTKINYIDTGGDGTPVVLLHAFPLNAGQWSQQIDALSDRFRFIAPDLKGFGGSDAPDDEGAYTMDSYADEVKGVLDAAGVDKAVVVGLSMGGYIALALWRRHPDVFAGLVLADSRAEADPPEGIEKRTNQQGQVREQGTAGLIEGLAGALLGETTRTNKPDVVENTKNLMDNPPAGFVGALEAMKGRPDSTENLASINVPTQVIVGENDGVTPPDASRKLHEHIGGSTLVVLPDAGHLSNLEAPDAFNGALGEFLGDL